ncbi:MAG: Quinone oxidoreductase, NADPH-dependent [Myxococcales bacterium]|nr:Quinone oxidoreductase, NADPH-dependent [Myxococcales bacterium]
MSKAIVVHAVGGPEALSWEDVPTPTPGPGEALIRQTAIGLNFIDVYNRTGLYKLPLPFVIGQEGAGVVEAVGEGVHVVSKGDRVAYGGVGGAYAELRTISAARLVPLPSSIDDRTAAAIMLKGLTAEFLLRRCAPVKAGDTILWHAAAGGVGSLACQWARHLGVHVIGTAGGPAKAALARARGCEHVIDSLAVAPNDVVARVKSLTEGEGVPIVFDSVGKDTFKTSLECLKPRGLLVSFGNASGAVPPFDPLTLGGLRSLYLTRPSLGAYVATREELVEAALALFEVVTSGAVKVDIGQTYPLADAAAAHRDLEARKTTGSTVLLP